ncbi:HTH_Tnp_Tc3_2 domain-containing protein [Trichonephila clavipes]|nr:HTH_Tnp_Tc3_2 domain-containing protein [Trichonephila clavipes]
MKVHVGEICKGLEMQRDCALRIAGRGRLTSFQYKTGGVGTRGSERCHLHENDAQDALDRPVVEKTAKSSEMHAYNQLLSSAAIQAQVAPSLGPPVSPRTIRTRLAKGHLGSLRPLSVLPLTPTHRRLRLSGAAHEEAKLQRNGARSSLATNPDSISAVGTIVFVCGDP